MTLGRIFGISLATLVVVTGCSGMGTTPSPTGVTSASVTLSVVTTTTNGPVLVGPNGHALYVHQGDSAATSTCTGGCLQAWPALTVPAGGSATARTGVPGTLATFVRPDTGVTQVTFDGMPLYYWTGDANAGEVTGHGVAGFAVVSISGSQPALTPCPSGCIAVPASATP